MGTYHKSTAVVDSSQELTIVDIRYVPLFRLGAYNCRYPLCPPFPARMSPFSGWGALFGREPRDQGTSRAGGLHRRGSVTTLLTPSYPAASARPCSRSG